MAIQSMYTAATGMKAMDFKLEVISNNLANIDTVAYKRSRANFEDILYVQMEQPGQRNGLDEFKPLGKQVGIGVQLSSTQADFKQGGVNQTENNLDLLIEGDGFFQVQAYIDGQEQTVFTRAGNFTRNANGDFILGNIPGARLQPTINVPQDGQDVSISQTGLVSYRAAGATEQSDAGQIELARFVNPAGLAQLGANLFQQTDASGPPLNSNPGQDGAGIVLQGNLELSNVDPARELIELIRTQRAFELNSQAIQTADETLQVVNQLRR
ncbi:MAG: flagellar basal-body rod protein FlgG [Phycisphaerales bacterium]|nr:flagellar basal-body rod protein FlgG [Phycisphaerales bacterium]MCB9862537.1 flagellar basal-body rod protein FlgG [Phycisphaerales bacterium]